MTNVLLIPSIALIAAEVVLFSFGLLIYQSMLGIGL